MSVASVRLHGFLTANNLSAALEGVERKTARLLVDATTMTDYEREARTVFVEWSRKRKKTLERIAIVVSKPVWRMVIGAMSVAASMDMRAFETVAEATAWLEK